MKSKSILTALTSLASKISFHVNRKQINNEKTMFPLVSYKK